VDLNSDGRPEILSGSYTPGELFHFVRRPNGTYAAPVRLKHANGKPIIVGLASAVSAADWDNDGDTDLVIGNIQGRVFLVPNTGTSKTPGFGDPLALKAGGQLIEVKGGDAGPCVADWDLDGKLDLLLGTGAGGVQWCRNVGSPEKPDLAGTEVIVPAPEEGVEISPAEFANPSGPRTRTKPSVGDWNGDGKPDLLVGDFSYQRRSETESVYHGWVWVFLRRDAVTAAGSSGGGE
jgi:hypothetical protein